MLHEKRIAVLIPAAGTGTRMRQGPVQGKNKILLPLGNEPIVVRTVRCFQSHPEIERIGLILRPEDIPEIEGRFTARNARQKLLPWILGGKNRQDSVRNGLEALAGDPPDWVLVHDGARPVCPRSLIDRVLDGLNHAPGVIPVLPVTDTVRQMNLEGSKVMDRATLFFTQTPQGFHWQPLWNAHQAHRESVAGITDDAQLLELEGLAVTAVAGDPTNIKVTTAEDLAWAHWKIKSVEEKPD